MFDTNCIIKMRPIKIGEPEGKSVSTWGRTQGRSTNISIGSMETAKFNPLHLTIPVECKLITGVLDCVAASAGSGPSRAKLMVASTEYGS